MKRPWSALGRSATGKKIIYNYIAQNASLIGSVKARVVRYGTNNKRPESIIFINIMNIQLVSKRMTKFQTIISNNENVLQLQNKLQTIQ